MDKSSIIRIPNDDVLMAHLQKKLQEYRMRYTTQNSSNFLDKLDTIFKIIILSSLLKHGRIEKDAIHTRLATSYQKLFDERVFINAFEVIKDYVLTGGQNVSRGKLTEL